MNTDKVEVKSTSMWHGEGGWPKDVDVTEQSDMARYRKRVEKNEAFQASVIALGPVVSNCMLQNNTINVYEKYDPGERDSEVETQIQPPSIKGIAVFRDPTPVKRSVSSIDWHPDGTRFAVSYSIMTFQDEKLQNVDMQTNVSNEKEANSTRVNLDVDFFCFHLVIHLEHKRFKRSDCRVVSSNASYLSQIQS